MANQAVAQTTVRNDRISCYTCGELGHYAKDCPKRVLPRRQAPRGRAFRIREAAARQDTDTITELDGLKANMGQKILGTEIPSYLQSDNNLDLSDKLNISFAPNGHVVPSDRVNNQVTLKSLSCVVVLLC
ncbi:hypothetical protein E3N88_10308 [Mikania micrantha]|uniref:CCHC-type domain-containing protein n=1 Tax=Mikania micrantha TaxID=192012 RepID=A0A5N6PCI6_9ASTR|nr:hypothetical protein E3N88_10308 [Mikania micrantha]